MRINSTGLAAAALFSAIAFAGSASAAITISDTVLSAPPATPAGQVMIADLDHSVASGFGLSGAGFTRMGSDGLASGVSAPPPGDLTGYMTVTSGNVETLTASKGLSAMSVYIGSPDSFNSIKFYSSSFAGGSETLSGAALFNPTTDFGGDQSKGVQVKYDFGGAKVTKVEFGSAGNSFEFDNVSGVTGVPEPTTWALMIGGLGLVGLALRRKPATAQAAA